MRLKRRGVETRIVLEGDSAPGPVDLPLVRAIARAHRWTNDLLSGRVKSIRELAKGEDINRRRYSDCCASDFSHRGWSGQSRKGASLPI